MAGKCRTRGAKNGCASAPESRQSPALPRSSPGVLVVLRKVIADLVPPSLRADEHVRDRLERWLVGERPVGHAKPRAVVVVDSPVEERPALTAAHCVGGVGVA